MWICYERSDPNKYDRLLKEEINTYEYLYLAAIGRQQNRNIVQASENGFTLVKKKDLPVSLKIQEML